MAEIRDIKDRIDSVKKTKKLTQAMKMVSAAKFKRASNDVLRSKPYLTNLEAWLARMIEGLNTDAMPPIMQDSHAKSNRELILLISSDKGLCGGFNANINKFAEEYIKTVPEVDLFFWGGKGHLYFKQKNYTALEIKESSPYELNTQTLQSILAPYIDDYLNGKYKKIVLFYNEFATALSSNLIKKQLLPLHIPTPANTSSSQEDYFFEPDKHTVLEAIVKEYLAFSLYKGLLESHAAEQGSRMAAMEAATSNAQDMIGDLTLVYNRTRQAKITTELSEIVAGAEALVS